MIVVVGANRGIGMEICHQYAAAGERVIGVCRKTSPALSAVTSDIIAGVDVTSDEAVAELAKQLEGQSIDVLINNAGILSNEDLGDLDFDRIRRQFEVNSVGPLRVTHALLPNLSPGSKIAIISSRMGSIGDNTSGGRYGYRMSKAAVNIAGVSLAHDLRSRKVAVAILHPGFVRTDMTGHQGLIDAPEAVEGLIARIAELTMETSGCFWHQDGDILPW